MKVHWQRHDHRLDVELAVALEVGARALVKAKSAAQLDRAIVVNLRLWQAVRRLADRCPALDGREMLAATADHVAIMLVAEAVPHPDPRDVAFVAGRSLSLARDLAGEAAANRARDGLVAQWSAGPACRFEDWMVDRLAGAACPSGRT